MIIVYTPPGGQPEQYDAKTLKVSEVSIVQRTIDMKWGEIKAGLAEEDLDAMRGIVWVLKKRSHPSLRWSEFDPGIDESVTRMDIDELREYVDDAMKVIADEPDLDWEQAKAAMGEMADACIDPEFARAHIDAVVAGPKEAPDEQPDPVTPPPAEVSQTPTSAMPETSTSDSSPISSTSPPQPLMS